MQPTANLESSNSTLPAQFTKKLLALGGALVSLAIVCAALWVLFHALRDMDLKEILQHLDSLPVTSIGIAYFLTTLSYLAVTGYDVIAQHHIKRVLPYGQTCIASFLASTFGNNIGFAMVTGSSIRYRIYSRLGLSILEIAAISTLCGITTTIGMTAIFALSLIFQSGELSQVSIPITPELKRFVGVGIIAVMGGYLIVRSIRPLYIRTNNWSLRLPSTPIVSAQMVLATLNLSIVASIIYALLPDSINIDPLAFLGVYALAIMASSASNVPGGLGVFETVLLLGLPTLSPAILLSSVLIFRCIYYLTPLVIAAIVFAGYEVLQQRDHITIMQYQANAWWAEAGPQVMSLMILLAGCTLLFSSVIPPHPEPGLLPANIGLYVMEFAQISVSVAGLALIVLARGISRRLRSAYQYSINLLTLGLVCSLLNTLYIEATIILAVVLALIVSTHDQFFRRATIFQLGFTVEWISLVTIIIVLTFWLGLFFHKDTPYSSSLWWYFALDGDYSRFLRSQFVNAFLISIAALFYLSKPDPQPKTPSTEILEKLRRIINRNWTSLANLALLGDKRILFSESGAAFLMYSVKGKHWVSLGNPVGPEEEYARLLLSFRELCERYAGVPVFYRIDERHLDLYLQNLSLSVDQVGEEALIDIDQPQMESGYDTKHPNRYLHLKDQGMEVQWIDIHDVPALLPELHSISQNWLSHTDSLELGFARSGFNSNYISRFPCCIARRRGHPIAFAVLWPNPDFSEIAVDLMRCHADAPPDTVNYLITELITISQHRGYRRLNIGMAPLNNISNHILSPFWGRAGQLFFNHGERITNVLELRNYYEQFTPKWRHQYIALPNGADTARALEDIASLIGPR